MSDTTAVESTATSEQRAAAESMGWIPPERFKGDPERYIDAEEYIDRGEKVLPIIKENNKRLQAELASVKASAAAQANALAQAQKAIEQIEERHTVATQKAVERAREEVKLQLARASEAGDHAGVAELTDQLTQLREVEAEPQPAVQVRPPPQPDPALVAWNAENPWFGSDRRKTALAIGIAQELREGGERSTGAAFFQKVSEEMEKTLPSAAPAQDKVEGARGGSDAPRGSKGKSFANLPADAKAACKADARNFVGPNKRYKTEAEWNTRYAEIYFEGEA